MTIGLLISLGVSMLTTIPVTALLCRYRIARQQRVSYGPMFAGACIVTLILLICISLGKCFTLDFWVNHHGQGKEDPEWPFPFLRLLGFITTICILPALVVVAYYQKRGKRDVSHVA
jgi:hypothetical protein